MATYTVKPGDTLSKIALTVMGDITRWPEISRANAMRPPYLIYPGQALRIPDGAAPAELAPAPAPAAIAPRGVAWLRNPLLWAAAAGLAWWWLRGRRRTR